jgi:glycerol-3-phosphate dehydrogenase
MKAKQTVAIIGGGSRASSKLLHGGLRYLENLEFRLVKEALRERAWWLTNCPQYTNTLKINIPVYKGDLRPGWQIKLGLSLYDWMAGSQNIGHHTSYDKPGFIAENPQLQSEGLLKGFSFYDGQMDDYLLGIWMANNAKKLGAQLHENQAVTSIDTLGNISLANTSLTFDYIVNVAGPWAQKLLTESALTAPRNLQLIRGSHLVLSAKCHQAYLLPVPGERRIFFVLPSQDHTLVGTTEHPHDIGMPAKATPQEIKYLLDAYNHYFKKPANDSDILTTFSGIRPLLESRHDPTRASREYDIAKQDRLITVFGGKWTTARALARQVEKKLSAAR